MESGLIRDQGWDFIQVSPGEIFFPRNYLVLKFSLPQTCLGGAVAKQRLRGHKVSGSNPGWSQFVSNLANLEPNWLLNGANLFLIGK